MKRKTGTKTSSFGVGERVNHDSSSFYNSRLYEGITKENQRKKRVKAEVGGKPETETKTGVGAKAEFEGVENPVPPCFLNRVFCKSSEFMEELPDNSVHLMVTSPPYNVGKDYDENLSLQEYLEFLKRVWKEVHRVLVPGARACINIANLGRKPYIPLHSYIIQDMTDLGFLMRGEVIWNKTGGGSGSTAWGSWLSAKNPTLRDVHEYILIFSKGSFSRNGKDRESSITKDEFLEFTRSVWNFSPESAKRVGHPAPFPVELPYRLIQLYTFKQDVVLDPFMGSGQTAIASLKSDRFFVGYEINSDYILLAEKRISSKLPGEF